MSTQGPLGPSFNGNGIAPPGTLDWDFSSGNLTALDGQYANVLSMAANDVTHYLYASHFGFAIPAGATINGVVVGWYLYAAMGQMDYFGLRLRSAGQFGGGATYSAGDKGSGVAGSGATWPTGSATLVEFGATNDTWGETLTAAIVNDIDFGAALSATASGLDAAHVDYVEMTITYTPVAGPPAAQSRMIRRPDLPTDPQFLE